MAESGNPPLPPKRGTARPSPNSEGNTENNDFSLSVVKRDEGILDNDPSKNRAKPPRSSSGIKKPKGESGSIDSDKHKGELGSSDTSNLIGESEQSEYLPSGAEKQPETQMDRILSAVKKLDIKDTSPRVDNDIHEIEDMEKVKKNKRMEMEMDITGTALLSGTTNVDSNVCNSCTTEKVESPQKDMTTCNPSLTENIVNEKKDIKEEDKKEGQQHITEELLLQLQEGNRIQNKSSDETEVKHKLDKEQQSDEQRCEEYDAIQDSTKVDVKDKLDIGLTTSKDKKVLDVENGEKSKDSEVEKKLISDSIEHMDSNNENETKMSNNQNLKTNSEENDEQGDHAGKISDEIVQRLQEVTDVANLGDERPELHSNSTVENFDDVGENKNSTDKTVSDNQIHNVHEKNCTQDETTTYTGKIDGGNELENNDSTESNSERKIDVNISMSAEQKTGRGPFDENISNAQGNLKTKEISVTKNEECQSQLSESLKSFEVVENLGISVTSFDFSLLGDSKSIQLKEQNLTLKSSAARKDETFDITSVEGISPVDQQPNKCEIDGEVGQGSEMNKSQGNSNTAEKCIVQNEIVKFEEIRDKGKIEINKSALNQQEHVLGEENEIESSKITKEAIDSFDCSEDQFLAAHEHGEGTCQKKTAGDDAMKLRRNDKQELKSSFDKTDIAEVANRDDPKHGTNQVDMLEASLTSQNFLQEDRTKEDISHNDDVPVLKQHEHSDSEKVYEVGRNPFEYSITVRQKYERKENLEIAKKNEMPHEKHDITKSVYDFVDEKCSASDKQRDEECSTADKQKGGGSITADEQKDEDCSTYDHKQKNEECREAGKQKYEECSTTDREKDEECSTADREQDEECSTADREQDEECSTADREQDEECSIVDKQMDEKHITADEQKDEKCSIANREKDEEFSTNDRQRDEEYRTGDEQKDEEYRIADKQKDGKHRKADGQKDEECSKADKQNDGKHRTADEQKEEESSISYRKDGKQSTADGQNDEECSIADKQNDGKHRTADEQKDEECSIADKQKDGKHRTADGRKDEESSIADKQKDGKHRTADEQKDEECSIADKQKDGKHRTADGRKDEESSIADKQKDGKHRTADGRKDEESSIADKQKDGKHRTADEQKDEECSIADKQKDGKHRTADGRKDEESSIADKQADKECSKADEQNEEECRTTDQQNFRGLSLENISLTSSTQNQQNLKELQITEESQKDIHEEIYAGRDSDTKRFSSDNSSKVFNKDGKQTKEKYELIENMLHLFFSLPDDEKKDVLLNIFEHSTDEIKCLVSEKLLEDHSMQSTKVGEDLHQGDLRVESSSEFQAETVITTGQKFESMPLHQDLLKKQEFEWRVNHDSGTGSNEIDDKTKESDIPYSAHQFTEDAVQPKVHQGKGSELTETPPAEACETRSVAEKYVVQPKVHQGKRSELTETPPAEACETRSVAEKLDTGSQVTNCQFKFSVLIKGREKTDCIECLSSDFYKWHYVLAVDLKFKDLSMKKIRGVSNIGRGNNFELELSCVDEKIDIEDVKTDLYAALTEVSIDLAAISKDAEDAFELCKLARQKIKECQLQTVLLYPQTKNRYWITGYTALAVKANALIKDLQKEDQKQQQDKSKEYTSENSSCDSTQRTEKSKHDTSNPTVNCAEEKERELSKSETCETEEEKLFPLEILDRDIVEHFKVAHNIRKNFQNLQMQKEPNGLRLRGRQSDIAAAMNQIQSEVKKIKNCGQRVDLSPFCLQLLLLKEAFDYVKQKLDSQMYDYKLSFVQKDLFAFAHCEHDVLVICRLIKSLVIEKELGFVDDIQWKSEPFVAAIDNLKMRHGNTIVFYDHDGRKIAAGTDEVMGKVEEEIVQLNRNLLKTLSEDIKAPEIKVSYWRRWKSLNFPEVLQQCKVKIEPVSKTDMVGWKIKGPEENIRLAKIEINQKMDSIKSKDLVVSDEGAQLFFDNEEKQERQYLAKIEEKYKCSIVKSSNLGGLSSKRSSFDKGKTWTYVNGRIIGLFLGGPINSSTQFTVYPVLESNVKGCRDEVRFPDNPSDTSVYFPVPKWRDGKQQEKETLRIRLGYLFMKSATTAKKVSISFEVQSFTYWNEIKFLKQVLSAFDKCNEGVFASLRCDFFHSDENKCADAEKAIQTFLAKEIAEHKVVASSGSFQRDDKKKGAVKISTKVVKGTLVEQKADVLVNTTSRDLQLSNGAVSASILKRAGSGIQNECKRKYANGINHGEIAETKGYNLSCKKVYHGALPGYNGSTSSLKAFVIKCLEKANADSFQTICFPSLGTGNLQYPKDTAAFAMFDAVEEFEASGKNKTLTDVEFVIYSGDKEAVTAFISEEAKRLSAAEEEKEMECQIYKLTITSCNTSDIKMAVQEIQQKIEEIKKVNEKPPRPPKPKNYMHMQNQSNTTGAEPEQKVAVQGDEYKQDRRVHLVHTEVERCRVVFTILDNSLLALEPESVKVDIQQKLLKLKVIGLICVVFPFCAEHQGLLKFGTPKEAEQFLEQHHQSLQKYEFKPLSAQVLVSIKAEISSEIIQIFQKHEELQSGIEKESGAKLVQEGSLYFLEGTLSDIENARQYLKKYLECQSFVASSQSDTIDSDSNSSKHSSGEEHSQTNAAVDCPKELYEMMIELGEMALSQKSVTLLVPENNQNVVVISGDTTAISQVKKAMQNLKQMQKEELTNLTNEEMEKAASCCIEMNKKDKQIHFRQLPAENRVKIFGRHYDDVRKAKIALSVAIGREKETGRSARIFDIAKENNSEILNQSSSATTVTPKGPTILVTDEGISVHVYLGDICNLDVDCIVNAANQELDHVGGIALGIATAAGDDLVQDCKNYVAENGPLPIGGTCITRSGNLKRYKYVVHTVGPKWDRNKDYQSMKSLVQNDLKKAVVECLLKANKAKCKSVALPAISSGLYGVPLNVCIPAYKEGVKAFSKVEGRTGCLREVHFVDLQEDTINQLASGFTDPHFSAQTKMQQSAFPANSASSLSRNTVLNQGKAFPHWGPVSSTPDKKPVQKLHVNDKITVIIYTGDILAVKYAHAIVSNENEMFTGQGRVASLLLKNAGAAYKKELEKLKTSKTKFQVTEVVDTGGGSLHFHFVIHAIMPIWSKDMVNNVELEKGFLQAYAIGVKNILKHAMKLPVDSFVMPLLGAGIKGIDTVKISNILTSTILKFCQEPQHENSILQSIYIVSNFSKSTEEVINSFQNLVQQQTSILQNQMPGHGKTYAMAVTQHADAKQPIQHYQKMHVHDLPCLYGKQPPNGTVKSETIPTRLPGYETNKTITMQFYIPGGHHRVKGGSRQYGSFETKAYLPDTKEGNKVKKLLETAFNLKYIFEVQGQAGHVDKIAYKKGLLKTRIHGGPDRFGYPDPNYLYQVTQKLADYGISEAAVKLMAESSV